MHFLYLSMRHRHTVLGIAACVLWNKTPYHGQSVRAGPALGFSLVASLKFTSTKSACACSWNLFFYPWYQQLLGVRNGCRLAVLLSIPLSMLTGLPSLLSVGPVGLQISLATILFFKNICATNAFTSAVLMVNAVGEQSLHP